MKISKLLWAVTLASWVALAWCSKSPDSPKVNNEVSYFSNEVFQLVWDKLIFTERDKIHPWMYYNCKDFNWSLVYLSDEKDILPVDWAFFSKLTQEEVRQIITSPDCKKKVSA